MSPSATTPHRGLRTALLQCAPVLGVLSLGGCVAGLFWQEYYPDQNRPVARIETRGGVEYGAATTLGIVFLGRTATEGPCRVHYFLGEQLIIEPGTIQPLGGVYYLAAIDLKHQTAVPLPRALSADDPLFAFVLDGDQVERIPVKLARQDGLEGDLLEDPGRELPAGAGIFFQATEEDLPQFVGLVAGTATLEGGATPEAPMRAQRFVVFTGLDRLREALLVPELLPAPSQIKYRPDGIWVRQKIPASELAGEK